MKTTRELLLGLLCAALLCYGCGDEGTVDPNGGGNGSTTGDVSINVNANDASQNVDLARWELPRLNANNIFISHKARTERTKTLLVNYCLEYNLQANHSQWVAYRFDTQLAANENGGNRTNAWNWDPDLNAFKDHQASTEAFPGYQRGHLIGSTERYYSDEANAQTFYMSNMSPMLASFNGNDWGNGIEYLIRSWGRAMGEGDTLYVVKGGVLDKTRGAITIKNTKGDRMQMAVPKYYFAACLKRLASGNVYAIGFYIEHKEHKTPDTNGQYTREAIALARSSACTIDELEKLTGLDFFCNMPDVFEDRVEARMDVSSWAGL